MSKYIAVTCIIAYIVTTIISLLFSMPLLVLKGIIASISSIVMVRDLSKELARNEEKRK